MSPAFAFSLGFVVGGFVVPLAVLLLIFALAFRDRPPVPNEENGQ